MARYDSQKVFMFSWNDKLIQEFSSIGEASRKLGIKGHGNLGRRLRDGICLVNGYKVSKSNDPQVFNNAKECLGCRSNLPLQFFSRNKTSPDGFEHCCINCKKTKPREELQWLGTKVCTICETVKPRTEFGSPSKHAHATSWCRDCHREYARIYSRKKCEVARSLKSATKLTCLKCNEHKSILKYATNKANPTGRNHYCNDCLDRYPKSELILIGDKTCTGCGDAKPRTEFVAHGGRIAPYCIACQERHIPVAKIATASQREYNRLKQQEWRKNNRERHQETVKAHQQKPEVVAARRKYQNSDQGKANQRRSHAKRSENLADGYILKNLKYNTGMSVDELKQVDGIETIIEAKRNLMKLRRASKSKKKSKQKKSNKNGKG